MLRLKRFVLLFFILLASGLYAQRWWPTASAGKNLDGDATLSAPTGVSASDGDYADKVSVMWNTTRGATLYRIFRSTSNDPSSATGIGTTAANYFFDPTATPNQNYFYWVRAESSGSNSSLSNSDQGLRAVGSFQSEIFSPLSPPPTPDGNQVTAAKASLGKALFWDEQLSSTLTVSCGTCHRSSKGGSDPRSIVNNARSTNPGFDNTFNTPDDVFGSPGVPLNNLDGTYSPSNFFGFNEQVTPRKAPSYLNSGFASNGLFWDGRAADTFRDPLTNAVLITNWGALESQVIGPPTSAVEMAHGNRNWTQVAQQIANAKPLALASNIPPSLAEWIHGRTYPELFQEAFGTPEVTPARIALAIATHERTLFSDRAPIDRYASAIESLTAQEDRGREIYVQSNCSSCHGGPLLSDQNFHNIGLRPWTEDIGREAVSGRISDRSSFKTPSLRNVELRAPYMHNGRFATLEEVVEFYNRGGDFDAPNVNDVIRPLNLTTEQKADLVAFLKRPMTDPRVAGELPPFDRPQLYTESNRVPVITGTGRAGSGGIVPQAVAIEPPLLGNPSFTVAVARGLGSAQAVLVIDANDPGVGSSIPASGSFARVAVNLTGSGNGNGFGSVSLPIPNNPALIGQTFYGRWYITDAGAANEFSVTQAFRFTIFDASSTAPHHAPADFDGDGKTDVSVFRTANGYWYINQSSNNAFRADQFGTSGDQIVPGDYDGDGLTDIAVFRPATGYWYILQSSDHSFRATQFGQAGDVPSVGDFDGDGKADISLYRPSNNNFYLLYSTDNSFHFQQWGANGDLPLMGDYDGDGKTDFAIFRPAIGTFYILQSSNGAVRGQQFGTNGDKPLAGDFDGDGKTDIAVFRPSTSAWYILNSTDNSVRGLSWGTTGDITAAGDYDGDGKWDAAIFRPSSGTFYILQSTNNGLRADPFGANGDAPVPSAYVP